MGGSHHQAAHRRLLVPGRSPVHRLPPSAKLVGLLVFTTAVALTPRRAVAAFAVDAAVVIAVVALGRLRPGLVLRRLSVITPFLAVAALTPFVSEGGPQVEVAGVTLSVDGLWAAWSIAAKALLGATAAIVLSATTSIPDLLVGLSKLRVPAMLVAIVAFMFRYLDLLVDELHRMRRAMVARCHDPRWLWQARPIAASAGALFVRSYERGERVHGAMVARGFTGTMPTLVDHSVRRREQVAALAPGLIAVGALVVATVTS